MLKVKKYILKSYTIFEMIIYITKKTTKQKNKKKINKKKNKKNPTYHTHTQTKTKQNKTKPWTILFNYLTKQYSNNIHVYIMFYVVCEEYGLKSTEYMRQRHFFYLK